MKKINYHIHDYAHHHHQEEEEEEKNEKEEIISRFCREREKK